MALISTNKNMLTSLTFLDMVKISRFSAGWKRGTYSFYYLQYMKENLDSYGNSNLYQHKKNTILLCLKLKQYDHAVHFVYLLFI